MIEVAVTFSASDGSGHLPSVVAYIYSHGQRFIEQ